MTEAEIKSEMRLWALESMVSKMCASILTTMPTEFVDSMHNSLLEGSKRNTFSNVDPAMSDHYSAEFEAATRRLIKMQRDDMAEGRKES